jgi:serine protease inhibitor
VINNWVEEKTENKIKELIPQGILNGKTKLVITNAIYFKGLWQVAFRPEQTVNDAVFHFLGNRGEVRVPMMRLVNTSFIYEDQSDHVVVGLPYKGRQTAMFILLPKENSAEALQQFLCFFFFFVLFVPFHIVFIFDYFYFFLFVFSFGDFYNSIGARCLITQNRI